jgi:hypothetical protein
MQARVGTGYSQSDIDKQDWPREACALTALRITAQPTNWKSALKSAIQQVKYVCHENKWNDITINVFER